MNFRLLIILVVGTIACLLVSCRSASTSAVTVHPAMPSKILWAWERAEDLRFIETKEFGVAFLAQTLYLQRDEVEFRPRRQPLQVAPETYLIAVTRIETEKGENAPNLSESQRREIIDLIKKSLDLPAVRAIQIDFDVVVSEREFYRSLITDLKQQLSQDVPFSITSLASWCVGDTWFKDLPIDEAVPMAFRMGTDDQPIRNFLGKGNDWNEPLCRGSYGIALNEPLKINFASNRKFFYFSQKAWKEHDLEKLQQ